jgi:hypothetical protein
MYVQGPTNGLLLGGQDMVKGVGWAESVLGHLGTGAELASGDARQEYHRHTGQWIATLHADDALDGDREAGLFHELARDRSLHALSAFRPTTRQAPLVPCSTVGVPQDQHIALGIRNDGRYAYGVADVAEPGDEQPRAATER